jgi:23S rRNA G2445 N2-methylase RlmL
VQIEVTQANGPSSSSSSPAASRLRKRSGLPVLRRFARSWGLSTVRLVASRPPDRVPSRPSLAQRVRDPGFTPSVRDVDGLVSLLAEDDLVKPVERAIGRLGVTALDKLRARFVDALPPLRARVVRAIGRLAQDAQAASFLVAALDDSDQKTRRNAAIALGHARAEGVEAALLRAWATDPRVEMRRSVAASLGRVGTESSLEVLSEGARGGDRELARIAERSSIMVRRTASRSEGAPIEAAREAGRALDVVAFARPGLEDVLAEELSRSPAVDSVRVMAHGRVRARLLGPMAALFGARTMLSFCFPLPTAWIADGETPSDAIARAVTSDVARLVFSTWTVGPPRFRIAWAQGGHRRAATWDAMRAIALRAPEFVNDPTASTWEVVVSSQRRFVDVDIAPRALEDPRFKWRRGQVPAASHPTVAAALARIARAQPDDVVWDPFVGSGAELIERALLGPFRSLFGSDVDADALATARANLDAAGVAATLDRADALGRGPVGLTLAITNPPMGRRSSRTVGLADMLDRFVAHVASLLVPGGRLVWIAPFSARSRAAAARAGLTLEWARVIDMGGFEAEMQRWVRG